MAWQLSSAVDGLADACRALGVPVVGGNVSLYNESAAGPIYPTPIVGMVGWLPEPARVPGLAFRREGHAVALVGPFQPALAGSELEKLRGGLAEGLPSVDLERQAAALALVRAAVRTGELASAHDVSDGGLACALAECAIAGGLGAQVDLSELPGGAAELLFGEAPGGVIVSGPEAALLRLRSGAEDGEVRMLGRVGGADLAVAAGSASFEVPVSDARAAYERPIPGHFG